MLYYRYSNPMTLICRYVNQRRFGKFVLDFFEAEYERKKQEAERDQEWMLWIAYVHSYSDKTFSEWRKSVMKTDSTTHGRDVDLTDKDIQSIIDGLFKQE